MDVVTITPRELEAKRAAGQPVDLLDVRTPAEFRTIHATIAKNVPLGELDPTPHIQGRDPARPLYVICRSGQRSETACRKFQAAGFTNVVNVAGGTLAWDADGLPVERGAKSVSLERQVRIVAGALVLLGVVLAYFVHPYCIGLSALIGTGLFVSGLTDTCGMGMVLAKMPWNRT